MKFAIITHVQHIENEQRFYGYAPYVREMNIWLKHVDAVEVVGPLVEKSLSPIHIPYEHSELTFSTVSEFNITSVKELCNSIIRLPKISWTIYKAMKRADHIHLRCPGNMGLLGAVIQIMFPSKKKTAKYAGNWDPKSKQPFTYKLQRWILSNTFLTKNMQVLVYGQWDNSTKNIKSFFTATYSETDKTAVEVRSINGKINFLFVGTLAKGKQPLYVVKMVESLRQQGFDVALTVFGDGKLRPELEAYIQEGGLADYVFLKGNQTKETVQQAYQDSHFLVLPSLSEGWPKVVAEAMFWGCVPVATKVSCVPYMLGYGTRGVLLEEQLNHDVKQLSEIITNESYYKEMAAKGKDWSREFTMEKFEAEIQKLIR
ncbi:glycosyltransferase family 4 protein [Flavobacterium pedocola]